MLVFNKLLKAIGDGEHSQRHNSGGLKSKARLSRDELIELIQNSKSDWLVLTQYDFTSTDFSGLNLTNVVFSDFHAHQTIDLSNANFQNCTIQNAKFSGAKFCKTTFRGSNLNWCDFRYANFEQCTFQATRLFGCDFYRTEFIGNNIFEDANLEGVSLYLANLEGAGIRRGNLGHRILQEDKTLFREYHRHYAHISPADIQQHIDKCFQEASVVYRALMGTWTSKGLLEDASWAYVKLKRMETLTFAPWRSWKIYSQDHDKDLKGAHLFFSRVRIVFKYLPKYVSNLFIDALCGFGESIGKVVTTFLFLFLVCGLYYRVSQGVVDKNGGVIVSLADNLLFSLGNLVSVSFDRLLPANSQTEFVMAFQSIVGIMLVGLLGFILGNKIRNS